jgi:soluble epoxide hydrolase/lipid-phosphate phosphatase
LASNSIAPPSSYITPAEQEIHRQIFTAGYDAAMNWYRAVINNIDADDELDAAGELRVDPMLSMPTLGVTARDDPISLPMLSERMKSSVRPGLLTMKSVESGHWAQLEKREEINAILEEWVRGVEGKGADGKL